MIVPIPPPEVVSPSAFTSWIRRSPRQVIAVPFPVSVCPFRFSTVFSYAGTITFSLESATIRITGVSPAGTAAVDPEETRKQVARLAELLADDDAEASELLAAHADVFRTAFGERYASLAEAINRFDFEKALAALNAARAGKEE